jgi:hypothetical protein
MMLLVGKAEWEQGAHAHHQANRDRGSEMQTWRQCRAVEKKRAKVLPLRLQPLEAVLGTAV